MKPIVILYHADCTDGFTAAWAAWKKFGSRASYVPVANQAPPPKGLMGKEIYTVDIAYPKKETLKLLRYNKRVTVIDHHIGNKAVANLTYKPLFDLKNSGASLSWKYFHPKKKIPYLVRIVEDGDLWRFKVPHTREIRSAMELLPFNFKTWSKLAASLESPIKRKEYVNRGTLIGKYEKELIGDLMKKAYLVKFHGKKILAVNTSVLVSDLGQALYKRRPHFSITWHEFSRGIKVSLRSDGKYDVRKIAEKYGGGGHKSAAAFKLPKGAKLPWKRVN